jgi:Zn-dependent protease/CBS domain-containing protein
VAIRQGEQVRGITLFLFGGVAQITREPDEPKKEFLMALVGPLTSIVIGGIFLVIWWLARGAWFSLAAVASWLMQMNFVLAVFNLVPGYPLDGGRILRSVIWRLTRDVRKATRAATRVGQGFAILLIGLGVYSLIDSFRRGQGTLSGMWLILIGWFLHSAAVRGYEQVLVRQLLSGTRVDQIMTRQMPWVPRGLFLHSLVHDHVLTGRGRAFLVGDGTTLEGIVCLSDAKKVPLEDWPRTSVGMVMTPRERLEVGYPWDNLDRILSRMTAEGCGQVPIMEGDRVVGLISRSEIVEFFRTKSELEI